MTTVAALTTLLESSYLDTRTILRELIENFDEYEYPMKAGCNSERFDALVSKGMDADISVTEVDELFGMLDDSAPMTNTPFAYDFWKIKAQMRDIKTKFTVVGYHEHPYQICSHHVEAESAQKAFELVYQDHPSMNLIAALPGYISEGEGIDFPDHA